MADRELRCRVSAGNLANTPGTFTKEEISACTRRHCKADKIRLRQNRQFTCFSSSIYTLSLKRAGESRLFAREGWRRATPAYARTLHAARSPFLAQRRAQDHAPLCPPVSCRPASGRITPACRTLHAARPSSCAEEGAGSRLPMPVRFMPPGLPFSRRGARRTTPPSPPISQPFLRRGGADQLPVSPSPPFLQGGRIYGHPPFPCVARDAQDPYAVCFFNDRPSFAGERGSPSMPARLPPSSSQRRAAKGHFHRLFLLMGRRRLDTPAPGCGTPNHYNYVKLHALIGADFASFFGSRTLSSTSAFIRPSERTISRTVRFSRSACFAIDADF